MKPVVLIVMDGISLIGKDFGNAVSTAITPNLDYLLTSFPSKNIAAHGRAVGLPNDDDMGNSEVGHNALGSGQIYAQGAKLVDESIKSGELFETNTWQEITKTYGTLHFIGLLSDGNVHSNIDNLIDMVKRAKAENVSTVRIHILLDGRDVGAQSALEYIDKLEHELKTLNTQNFDARIASGGGRQTITMDRYGANWAMVERGWNTHVHGKAKHFANARDAVLQARAKKPEIIDQDIEEFVIAENNEPIGKIADGDSVVLFNFRGDRAIQISQAFEKENFKQFDRGKLPKVCFAGMLQYDGDTQMPKNFLLQPPRIINTLTDHLADHGIHQFAVSETQKFGHVTYFWNGNRSEKVNEKLEDWVEIVSDILPFEERPWMKAAEITDQVINAIKSGRYGFIRANFPNGDMVGHTGNYQAAQNAVSSVDLCLGRIIKSVDEAGAMLVITADHGNAEEMLSADRKTPKTAHSLNPVPFIIYNTQKETKLKEGNFGLANVAATVACLLEIKPHHTWEESMI